jgi:hypothetical protein
MKGCEFPTTTEVRNIGSAKGVRISTLQIFMGYPSTRCGTVGSAKDPLEKKLK